MKRISSKPKYKNQKKRTTNKKNLKHLNRYITYNFLIHHQIANGNVDDSDHDYDYDVINRTFDKPWSSQSIIAIQEEQGMIIESTENSYHSLSNLLWRCDFIKLKDNWQTSYALKRIIIEQPENVNTK